MAQTIELISKSDEKDIRLLYSIILSKRLVPFAVIGAVAGAFFLLMAVLDWRMRHLIWAAYCIGYAIWCALRPGRMAKKAYKQRVEYYNGNPPAATVRFGDQIELTDSDSFLKIPYEKVNQIRFVNACVILILETKAAYLFRLDNFVSGDLTALHRLLDEKCTNVKKPK